MISHLITCVPRLSQGHTLCQTTDDNVRPLEFQRHLTCWYWSWDKKSSEDEIKLNYRLLSYSCSTNTVESLGTVFLSPHEWS